jgi:hypothetical protein
MNTKEARHDRRSARVLIGIKLLHTAAWAFLAGCVLLIPFAGVTRNFRGAAILSGIVLLECAILAVNGGRCPLTNVAARYTEDRRENFDIYLPLWLARYNKQIFGTIFVLSELLVLALWFGWRG